jgi:hypothetical protein
LPDDVVAATRARYLRAYEVLAGLRFADWPDATSNWPDATSNWPDATSN